MSDEIEQEAAAVERLHAALDVIATDLHFYWSWGDGEGGWVLNKLASRVRARGFRWPTDTLEEFKRPAKAVIGQRLRTMVFERDAYRCVTCGTHYDLTCDHIIPESKGGPTTFENLQTMCRPCNSRKGAR